jgi:hypothetical protein
MGMGVYISENIEKFCIEKRRYSGLVSCRPAQHTRTGITKKSSWLDKVVSIWKHDQLNRRQTSVSLK